MTKAETLPNNLPKPSGYYLLVKPYVPPSLSSGGIILPEETQKTNAYLSQVNEVVAMGPDAFSNTDKFPSGPRASIGDFVVINRQAGIRIQVRHHPADKEEQPYKLVNDADVLAVVDNPAAIVNYAN